MFVRRILAVSGLALAVSSPARAQGDAEPDEDEVCILAPQDGTTFDGAPATIEVDIEATHGSNLVIEEVGLRVDGVDFEGTCPGPGACSFQVELDAGEHELRAYASRNLGPELVSNIVTVTVVVADGGTSSSTGASSGSGESSTSASGASTGGAGASTGDAEPGGDEGGREEAGCGCTQHGGGPSAMATLVVLLVAGRRRRKASAR